MLFSFLHTPGSLVTVVLLIYVYMIHQELQIHRIRRRLTDQLLPWVNGSANERNLQNGGARPTYGSA